MGCSRKRALDDGSEASESWAQHLEKAVFCYRVSKLSHSYEQMTELLADVEVDNLPTVG